MGEVIIAKHRNGSLENVQLKFIGKFTKFADLSRASARLPALAPCPAATSKAAEAEGALSGWAAK